MPQVAKKRLDGVGRGQRPPRGFFLQVEDLTQQIQRAGIFYDLWWPLKGPELEFNIDAANLFPDYFRFTHHAHLVAMIVHLMMPFESTGDRLSLESVINAGTREGLLSPQDRDDVRTRVRALHDRLQRIKLIRHKCFAHRSNAQSYDEVWNEAKVSAKDFKSTIDEAREAVNVLRRSAVLDPVEAWTRPKESSEALFALLRAQCDN